VLPLVRLNHAVEDASQLPDMAEQLREEGPKRAQLLSSPDLRISDLQARTAQLETSANDPLRSAIEWVCILVQEHETP
jgi:hypothetical protein